MPLHVACNFIFNGRFIQFLPVFLTKVGGPHMVTLLLTWLHLSGISQCLLSTVDTNQTMCYSEMDYVLET